MLETITGDWSFFVLFAIESAKTEWKSFHVRSVVEFFLSAHLFLWCWLKRSGANFPLHNSDHQPHKSFLVRASLAVHEDLLVIWWMNWIGCLMPAWTYLYLIPAQKLFYHDQTGSIPKLSKKTNPRENGIAFTFDISMWNRNKNKKKKKKAPIATHVSTHHPGWFIRRSHAMKEWKLGRNETSKKRTASKVKLQTRAGIILRKKFTFHSNINNMLRHKFKASKCSEMYFWIYWKLPAELF